MEIISKIINTNYNLSHIKKQIVLINTSISIKSYLKSLELRHFNEFNRVPNYVITKEGQILKTLEDNQHTKLLNSKMINQQSIIISLENLGWLEKEPLKNYHINWIGDIYKEKVFEKKWREKFFWDPYTKKQIDCLVFLCKKLCKSYNINLESIGHNTKINGAESFNGIISRSNFDETKTDLSPAFDFEMFEKKLKNE